MMENEARPKLSPNVILRYDPGRDRWVILAPERVLSPDAIAVEILKRCDGKRSVAEIAAELAVEYKAPPERVLTDVSAMLVSLAEKGVIV